MSTLPLIRNAGGRRLEPELMDQPTLERDAHVAALVGLRRLNAWSLADRLFWAPMMRLLQGQRGTDEPLRVLDAASGAGDIAIRLAQRVRRAQLSRPIEFTGWDISEQAVAFACHSADRAGVEVAFERRDVFADDLSEHEFDVVISSLFLHHLDEEQATTFLTRVRGMARQMIVVSDLRRCSAGLALAWTASRVLTRSYVVHFDAPQSVRAAFDDQEIGRLFNDAGLGSAIVERVWPFRFRIVWQREEAG